jgi:hypothetical protein
MPYATSKTHPNFGRGGSGNPNPNYSGFNSQGTNPRGRRRVIDRELLEYCLSVGAIPDMTTTPSIDFLRQCVDNVDLRLELRITAASYAARYEARPLAARPWAPDLPSGYRLRHDLKTTESCLEAHRQLSLDVLEGKIAADAATYVSEKFILPRIPHLEISEVRQELESFRQLVEQAKEQRDLEARLTTSGDYEVTVTEPPPPDTDILK